MHGEGRPWRRIDIPMVHAVYPLVERSPVNEPVNHMEMDQVEYRGQQEKHRQIDWIVLP